MTRRCRSGKESVVIYDQIMVGRIKFLGKGTPPDRQMGRLFAGFMPCPTGRPGGHRPS